MTEADFRKAAKRVIAILNRWGVDTAYARNPYFNFEEDTISFALDYNFIKFRIKEEGLYVQSSHAMFTNWHGPITSYEKFKKDWKGHIQFNCPRWKKK